MRACTSTCLCVRVCVSVCMYACMYQHMSLCACVCICVHVCMYVPAHVFVCVCVYLCACMRVRTSTCLCVRVCVSVCMYACTYQHSSAHVVPGSRPQHHLLDDRVGIRLTLQGGRLVLVHRSLTRDRLHARRVCAIKPWFYSLLVVSQIGNSRD